MRIVEKFLTSWRIRFTLERERGTEWEIMHLMELSADTVPHWLALHGVACTGGQFTDLGGGISNLVVLAQLPGRSLVIKQSLARLRVQDEWLSERDRIFREAAAMRWLGPKMTGGHVPELVIEDRENFAIAMEAAPEAALMWKTRLFDGVLEAEDARSAGALLGSMVSVSHGQAEAQALFGDQTVFDQLRIDPYYRTTAARHPACTEYFNALMAESGARRFSLTHGDWSPKNLLTDGHAMWVIDWEVIHYGDPSFDVAFLLNHLFLKSLMMPSQHDALTALAGTFLQSFEATRPAAASWVVAASARHLPALLLARVDGKSPVEYLDEAARLTARACALRAIATGLNHPLEIFA